MARFVWTKRKGDYGKRYCWDTENRVFAEKSKCRGGLEGVEKVGAAERERERWLGPPTRFVWKTKGNKRRCFDVVRDAWAPVAKCRTKRRFGRFGWRKVCWNNDTEEVVADAKCERRPVKRHRFCLQPSGECWDREAEKNVAPNMCGNPHARRAGWVARPCGS